VKLPAWPLAWPLIAFLVPSIVIGYGFVLPRAGHAGVDELTIGYATTLAGACATYVLGIRAARKEDRS
jgi:hypothetical protein